MIHSCTRRMALTAMLSAACLMAMPGAARAADAVKKGGTLVVGNVSTPRHLNGAVQSGIATAMPSTQLFASPLRFDADWKPQPYLAERWELASDNKSLTLHLRKNAVFHDGKPITSADVAFSIMAIKANHPFSTMLEPVTGVDTPDPQTAIIRMSAPHPAILLAMSPGLAPILPKHVYDDGQDLKNHPRNSANVVGSGPFKLVEFTPGQRAVLERFDKFFLEGKPYLDKVVFSYIQDVPSLTLSLERGDLQMVPFLNSPTELKRLSANKDITVIEKGYEGIGALTWIGFNLRREPLNKLEVRQAIAHAIDKNFVSKVLQAGFSKVSEGPLAASSPFATPDLVRYPVDIKKSAKLLDDAGYKAQANGERFALAIDYIPGDALQKSMAEYVRAQLKKVGINVTVRASADFPTWAKRVAAGDFDMTVDSVFNWGDPVIGVHRTYLSTNIKPIIWTNTQAYANPEVDKLLAAAAVEADPVKRKAEYVAFQKLVTHDLPILFVNEAPYRTAASTKVGNVPATIWGALSPYDEVYLK